MREVENKSPLRILYGTELKNDKFSIFLTKSENNPKHCHHFFELAYVKKGPVRHIFNDCEQLLETGDYIIVDYGAQHGYEGKDIAIINCLFLPELIDRTVKSCSGFDALLNNYLIRYYNHGATVKPEKRVYHDDDGSILVTLERMADEYRDKIPGYMELIRCYLIEIIIKTMRTTSVDLYYNEENGISKYVSEYISLNYARQLNLTELCENLSYSLPYVSKKFKEETGETFVECLQRVRLEEACRLLGNTNLSIETIGHRVGYNDIKYFRAIFKEVLKMTPKQFRKQVQVVEDIKSI